MVKENQLLTTSDFASQTGIATSKVSKLIREGKIKAEKISGKWMIDPSQLKEKAALYSSKVSKASSKQKAAAKKSGIQKEGQPAKKKTAGVKAYSVAEFVDMTYLTEYGVKEWLKQGRLTGQQNETGEWRINAANLDVPHIQRLVRKNRPV